MKLKIKKILGCIGSLSIILGAGLLSINLIGLFVYTEIDDENQHVTDRHARTIDEQEFWNDAFKKDDESLEVYVVRLTDLVSNRMLLINPEYTKPTVFENWILWGWSQKEGYYEWIDTRKAVRLGGGFCSQHAIILNNILRNQDIEARILALEGHVLNEVKINGTWRVYDSDFNVSFKESLRTLENNPEKVFQVYKDAGISVDQAKYIQEIFESHTDNWHYLTSIRYSPRQYVLEKASFILIWVLPLGLLLLGLSLKKLPDFYQD